MTVIKHLIAAALLSLLAALPAGAVVIKVGSIAPEGSPWDRALKKVGAEWSRISGGTIQLKIYPGGIVGNEIDMTRKMRIGQLQAGVFTGSGMSYITPEVFAISLPFLIQNDSELDYVMKKMEPALERLIDKKGFTVAVWSRAGWIHFFSKKPVIDPADLKKQKLAVAEGDADQLQAWRVMGYNAVPLSTNDLMTALQNGMVEAFYSPPLVAAAFQWFGVAQNMCGLKMAPMIGGIVVNKKTWEDIPAELRPKLRAAAAKIVDELYSETLKLEAEAMLTMKKHGLKVHSVPAQSVSNWEKEAVNGWRVYAGKTFPQQLLVDLRRHVSDYRKK